MNITTMAVVLDVDWTPEGYLTEEQVVDQRMRIADAQSDVIQQIRSREASAQIRRFEYIPILSVPVSETVLSALDSAPKAKRVEIAPPAIPLLSTTTVRTEATKLWARGPDGSGQVVAILDTGVNTPDRVSGSHPALNGKVIGEACFSTHQPGSGKESLCFGGGTSTTQSTAYLSARDCGSFASGCGHGSFMAGIVAANSSTMKGMAPGAKIYAITTVTSINGSVRHEVENITDALSYVYSIRNSFNFSSVLISAGSIETYSSACDSTYWSPLTFAAANLRSVGIIPVAGAGNSGVNGGISGPACISHVVSVGATKHQSDDLYSGTNRANFMDLWAPGGEAVNATFMTTDQYATNHTTCCTSAAGAVVAGAFAAMKSGFPGQPTAVQLINSAKSAGVVLSGAGLGKPRLALDLAVPPSPLSVQSEYCYGYTYISWPSLETANWYILERAPLGTTNWQTAYQGSGTSHWMDVPVTSVFRVKACNGGRCGGFNEVSGVAIRYGYCQ